LPAVAYNHVATLSLIDCSMENMLLRRLMLLGLVGLLAVASPGPAAVFCVAGDGHAAIEEISSPCCNDEVVSFGPARIFEPPDTYHRDAACGPCVDIQLTSPSRLTAPAGAALPVDGTPIMLSFFPPLDMTVRAKTYPAGRITPPPTLELLASVVLLT